MKKTGDNVVSRMQFSIGLLLIILNLILGKVALPLFVIEPTLSIVIYLASWGMLIVGILMCGKEGWYVAKRYIQKHEKTILKRLIP
jgi:hypothetical protein